MKNFEFWLIVGSQSLHGSEVLQTVDEIAREEDFYVGSCIQSHYN